MTTSIQPPAFRILSPPVATARSQTQAKCTVCDARKATKVVTSIVRKGDEPTASALRIATSRFPATMTADSRAVARTSIAACWPSTVMGAIMLSHVRRPDFGQADRSPRSTIASSAGERRDPLASRLSDQYRYRGGHHETSGTAPDSGGGESARVRHVRDRRRLAILGR